MSYDWGNFEIDCQGFEEKLRQIGKEQNWIEIYRILKIYLDFLVNLRPIPEKYHELYQDRLIEWAKKVLELSRL